MRGSVLDDIGVPQAVDTDPKITLQDAVFLLARLQCLQPSPCGQASVLFSKITSPLHKRDRSGAGTRRYRITAPRRL
ncbi:unnamed protein product [Peniophora sp. CBMAI 1063]|nr:unnamed protein product [Peniophora sp. CBMAI 1063]